MIQKFLIFISFIFLFFFLSLNNQTFAQSTNNLPELVPDVYVKGQVTKIITSRFTNSSGSKNYYEKLQVQLLEGKDKGKDIPLDIQGAPMFGDIQKLSSGDQVVVNEKLDPSGKVTYSLYEAYRLGNFWWVLAAFCLFIVFVAGRKGVGALIGLSISIAVITLYIIPQIVNGVDPLSVCVNGALIILIFTTYIAHGVSVKTTIAIIGTGISLLIAVNLSSILMPFLHLIGLGNMDVYDLQLGTNNKINPESLLLGGILIGTLGALNDITTTQSLTIFTFVRENPTQKFYPLFKKSMEIGKEHIASLINTLILAYVGSTFGAFIYIAINPTKVPLWVILNNETTVEDMFRALMSSSALVLAVPITTILACLVALHGKKYFTSAYSFVQAVIHS